MSKTITPYNTAEAKKKQVQTMFDNIAPKYDLLNRILSFGIDVYWRNVAIKALKKYDPKYILDVACGTGDFSIAALKTNPEKIIGVDISTEMLEAGKKKIAAKKLENKIELIKGDSEQLLFDDKSFDAVTVAFGVRNFENLDIGIKEMYRVLKTNAPLIILEFSKPKIFPVKQLFNFYFKAICPIIGRLLSKDARAYTYLYESVSAFPEGEFFLQHLRDAGFKTTTCRRLTFGICSMYIAIK
ncbi:MAG: bifunctional demethylmenaquinone methyltransferase/2-methoxy-6-polyprenyl-1,4-benzoquinol methylase UbiE [Fimbriimonadaceae bacterium]|nr:bifunctional demethylmenaquinone methyltransferase/2-methoxy-6-polyprenyl-1,4-benzoquinol methylase UbiE [Chitinophagales bacterium]